MLLATMLLQNVAHIRKLEMYSIVLPSQVHQNTRKTAILVSDTATVLITRG